MWSDKGRTLSDRLQVMTGKVNKGERCADIGTDHGYLGLYLYEQGISPSVILTDISRASLDKAKAASGASQFGSGLLFRVGDGLQVIDRGEVDCVVIAGMGGKLIRDIMAYDLTKTKSLKKFVLQPRTGSGPLRKWLLEAGFSILSEDIVAEGDFLPEIITVAPKEDLTDPGDFAYFDRFPGMDLAAGIRSTLLDPEFEESCNEDSIHYAVPVWMLNAGGPVQEFIKRKINIQEDISKNLSKAKNRDEDRLSEIKYNIDYLKQLLQLRKHREEHERMETNGS